MNKILLFLGLTILYYIVLFTLDKRRKAAFKKVQQQVIGQTTALPKLSENIDAPVFGTTSNVNNLPKMESEITILNQTLAENNEEGLQENLEEMMIDLHAEETFETSKNNLITQLAATTEDQVNEEEAITNLVAKITKQNPNASFF